MYCTFKMLTLGTFDFLGMCWESGVVNRMIIRVFCSWCAMYVETQPSDGSLSLAACLIFNTRHFQISVYRVRVWVIGKTEQFAISVGQEVLCNFSSNTIIVFYLCPVN